MVNSVLEEKDTQVLGISTNAKPVQTAFSQSLGGIPYPILSDFHPHGAMCRLYDVYNEERGTAKRSVILIDKQGVIRFKRIYSDMSEFDMAEIIAEVDKL